MRTSKVLQSPLRVMNDAWRCSDSRRRTKRRMVGRWKSMPDATVG